METKPITIVDAIVKRSGPRMTIRGRSMSGADLRIGVDEIDFSGTMPESVSAKATDKKTGQVYLLV